MISNTKSETFKAFLKQRDFKINALNGYLRYALGFNE
jgi:hypothetical protein